MHFLQSSNACLVPAAIEHSTGAMVGPCTLVLKCNFSSPKLAVGHFRFYSMNVRWLLFNLDLWLFSRSVVSDSLRPHCSTPGFPVFYHLLELAQTHVHWTGDPIQPSRPLLSPSPHAFSLDLWGLFLEILSFMLMPKTPSQIHKLSSSFSNGHSFQCLVNVFMENISLHHLDDRVVISEKDKLCFPLVF